MVDMWYIVAVCSSLFSLWFVRYCSKSLNKDSDARNWATLVASQNRLRDYKKLNMIM